MGRFKHFPEVVHDGRGKFRFTLDHPDSVEATTLSAAYAYDATGHNHVDVNLPIAPGTHMYDWLTGDLILPEVGEDGLPVAVAPNGCHSSPSTTLMMYW